MKKLTPKKMVEIAKRLIDLAMEGKSIKVFVRDQQPDGEDFEIQNITVSDFRGGDGERNVSLWINSGKKTETMLQ